MAELDEAFFDADEGKTGTVDGNYFFYSKFFKFRTKYSYKGWMLTCPAIMVEIKRFIQAFTMFWLEEIIDFDNIYPEM